MNRAYKIPFNKQKLKAYHEDPEWNKVKDLCGTTFSNDRASHNKGKFTEANEMALKIMERHGCLEGE